ncbi:MAG TPA: glycosyltransferase family 39 protein [Methylomirabilota bacterium]|nr:glycosyltransferase family 39 protein [Methylomirabilota bacterium]
MSTAASRIAALLAVMVLAAGLRVALLDRQGLWADELFSLAIATGHSLEHPAAVADPARGDYVEAPTPLPAAAYRRYLEHENPPAGFSRIIRALRLSDTSPPLYYLLLSGWTRQLGTSDAVLRLFSALWGLATVPVLWLIARRVGGEPAALPAALLFAINPLGLYYSVGARMYSMVMFLAASLIALTLRLGDRPLKPWPLTVWTLVSAAALLTHYFTVFVWVACLVWLAMRWRQIRWAWIIGAVLVTGLLVLPWYVVVPESLRQWRVTRDWLYTPLGFRALVAPFEMALRFVSGRGPWGSSIRSQWLAGLTFAPVGVALVLAFRRRLFSEGRGLVLLCVVAACVGPVVFDLLRGTSTALRPRYALAGLPGMLVLAAVGLARIRLAGRVALLLVIALAWSSGVRAILRLEGRDLEPYREIAVSLSKTMSPRDLILVHSIPSGVLGIARYAEGSTMIASWVGQLGQRRVPADVEAFTEGREKVVLVRIHEIGAPAPEESWLRDHARLVGESHRGYARLSVFEPRSGERFVWSAAARR